MKQPPALLLLPWELIMLTCDLYTKSQRYWWNLSHLTSAAHRNSTEASEFYNYENKTFLLSTFLNIIPRLIPKVQYLTKLQYRPFL